MRMGSHTFGKHLQIGSSAGWDQQGYGYKAETTMPTTICGLTFRTGHSASAGTVTSNGRVSGGISTCTCHG